MSSTDKMNQFFEQNQIRQQTKDDTLVGRSGLRIRQLLDKDSFVELNQYVKHRHQSDLYPRAPVLGDGVTTGYGTIGGRLVYVACEDSSVYGGSVGQMHASKITETIYRAIHSAAPFIILFDTGGVRIEEGILALEGMAGVLTALSEACDRIPLIAGIFGHCPGASAVCAGLCHFRYFIQQTSGMYINGPMLTASFEEKKLEPYEIGGTPIHEVQTGAASFTAANESDCLHSIRQMIDYLPGYDDSDSLRDPDDANRVIPQLDKIAQNMDQGYHPDDILRLMTDRDSFLEVSHSYEPGAITALAKMDGCPVGIIAAREKRMTNKMTRKLTCFIRTCEQLGFPLISIVDSHGFALGLDQETSDIISQSASLACALNMYPHPKISLIIGDAIGTTYLLLASKQFGFDFVYAWPTARVCVMNPDSAATILYRDQLKGAADPIQARKDFIRQYEEEIASVKSAASYGHIDEIIMPSMTRIRMISALQVL